MLFELTRENGVAVGFKVKPDPQSEQEKIFVSELPITLGASGHTIGDVKSEAVILGEMVIRDNRMIIASPLSKSGMKSATPDIKTADAEELVRLTKNPNLKAQIFLGTWTDKGFVNEDFTVRFVPKTSVDDDFPF